MPNNFCQMDLQGLKPKRTTPRRAGSIELVKNCDETIAMLFSQRTQDRQQSKWDPALLESVVYVMEQDCVELCHSCLCQALERHHFESTNTLHGTLVKGRKQCLACKVVAQFSGNRKRVISNPVDPSGNSRNDLQKRAQDETASPRCD